MRLVSGKYLPKTHKTPDNSVRGFALQEYCRFSMVFCGKLSAETQRTDLEHRRLTQSEHCSSRTCRLCRNLLPAALLRDVWSRRPVVPPETAGRTFPKNFLRNIARANFLFAPDRKLDCFSRPCIGGAAGNFPKIQFPLKVFGGRETFEKKSPCRGCRGRRSLTFSLSRLLAAAAAVASAERRLLGFAAAAAGAGLDFDVLQTAGAVVLMELAGIHFASDLLVLHVALPPESSGRVLP